MNTASWIEINLRRIDENVDLLRQMMGTAEGQRAKSKARHGIARSSGERRATERLTAAANKEPVGSNSTSTTTTATAEREDEVHTADKPRPHSPITRMGRLQLAKPVRVEADIYAQRHARRQAGNQRQTDEQVAARLEGATRPLLCAVVKADAYGMGAATIAQRLAGRNGRGADMLAVYSPAQAEQLAALNLDCPTLVLMRVCELSRNDPLFVPATTGRTHFTIHDREQLHALDYLGRTFGSRLCVHLYVDTGMSRGGLNIEQAAAALREMQSMRHLRLSGISTHLANADGDPGLTDEQIAPLDSLIIRHQEIIPSDVIVHVANTMAALRFPHYRRDMVRMGLGLYGYANEIAATGQPPDSAAELQPVLRWLSRIIHIQRYPRGAAVGYAGIHRLQRDSVLGVVPVGYADGYPLTLTNKSSVDLAEAPLGQRPPSAPVIGRINMDQIVIDLTDAASDPANPVRLGARVVLISDDSVSACTLPRLAKLAGSTCHEMLCRLSPRVHRRYLAGSAE